VSTRIAAQDPIKIGCPRAMCPRMIAAKTGMRAKFDFSAIADVNSQGSVVFVTQTFFRDYYF
jgi:hypothetical protein